MFTLDGLRMSPRWAAFLTFLLVPNGGCFRAQEVDLDELRREVVKAASSPEPARALPLAEQALGSPSARYRTFAAIELRADDEAQARALAPLTIPLLSRLLGDESPFVRREAANSLGSYGAFSKPALSQLRQRLREDPMADIGWFSLTAIGNIGPGASEALPDLLAVLNKAQRDGWRGRFGESELLTALGQIGPTAHEAVPVLVNYIDRYLSGDYRYASTIGFVEEAAIAIARIDRSGSKLEQTLEWMSTSTDAMRRFEAMEVANAIAEFERPAWLQKLAKRGLEDPEADIRMDWARTLEKWGSYKPTPDNKINQ
jgi:HEAT repeat protein